MSTRTQRLRAEEGEGGELLPAWSCGRRRVGWLLLVALVASLIVFGVDALLWNSLLVAAGTTVLSLVLGMAVALTAAGLSGRWRYLLLALSLMALIYPPFLVTNCWLDLLGETGGWVEGEGLNIYSRWGVILVLTSLTWPIALVAALSGWSRVEREQLEADPALSGWAVLRWLLWPASRAMVGLAAVLIFVLALNNFSVPAILQVQVYPARLWFEFNTRLFEGGMIRYGWPLVLGPLLLLWVWGRDRTWWPARGGAVWGAAIRDRLGRRWNGVCGLVTILVLGVSVALPLVEMVVGLGDGAELASAFAAGKPEVLNSVAFAAAAASLCSLFGLVGWKWRVGPLVWLPFLVPGVLIGVMLIHLFNRPGLQVIYHGAGIMVLGLAVRYVGVAWSGVAHAMAKVDRDLVDVARLSGAGWWQVMRHVRWPQVAAPVLGFWYLTYLLCLWDVGTSVMIQPAGGGTIALRVFNLLHYHGHNPQVNALCLILLLLALGPLLVWGVVRWAWRFRGAGLAGVWLVLTGIGCGVEGGNQPGLESRFFSEVKVIGSRGTGAGEFNKPRSVAVDGADNLYVADMTGRVQKFSPEGDYLQAWQFPETESGRPKGMCRDGEGNIVVVEPHYGRVNHYGPDGTLRAQWGIRGTNTGELSFPRAVAVTSRGDVVLSEYGPAERVQWFSARGSNWLASVGQEGKGPAEFNRPEGLGIDAQDRIYVADSCNHRVQVLDADGRWLRSYGRAGDGLGELSYPYDVWVDGGGNQFVCEFGNSRVQVFGPDFEPIEILGGVGQAPGRFDNPWSLAMDSHGNLYVADSGNHRVQKWVRR